MGGYLFLACYSMFKTGEKTGTDTNEGEEELP